MTMQTDESSLWLLLDEFNGFMTWSLCWQNYATFFLEKSVMDILRIHAYILFFPSDDLELSIQTCEYQVCLKIVLLQKFMNDPKFHKALVICLYNYDVEPFAPSNEIVDFLKTKS